MRDITYDWEFQSNLYRVHPVITVKLPGNYLAFMYPNDASVTFISTYVKDSSIPAPESERDCP